MTSIETDIVIVGSGAAGGVLAATLSEFTGQRIILVEKGGHFTHEYFDQREIDMSVLYADRGGRSTVDGAIPVQGGECVGGGTTINYALSFDPRQDVWHEWKRDYGAGPFSFDRGANDFGVSGLDMASCLADVRKRINVHEPADVEINDNNRIFADGCKAAGISVKRFELNMIDCIGCGYCGQGCAYDRKLGTMTTYVRDARRRNVRLIHHCDVERVEFVPRASGMAATGISANVRPTMPGSEQNSVDSGPLSIRARLVILSAGAIATPVLLQRSGYPNPEGAIGKGLVLHPSLPIGGVFDRDIINYRGITGAFYSDHFYGSHGFYYECLFDHPVAAAVALPGIGADHFALMTQYSKLAGFGVMLVDTSDPANRVDWDAAAGAPAIRFRVTQSDKERLRFAARTGVDMMFAAGAKEVILTTEEQLGPLANGTFKSRQQATLCDKLEFNPCQTFLSSAHCQATVKMGEDAKRCPVNSRGETRAVRNLLVCDASVFPTSCGANPMISVMTLARYQGKRIANELSRYGM
jgi:choline dehydrogenase-like flavoprotein